MDKLAEKYINDHQNPVVKIDLPDTKLFLKPSFSNHAENTEKSFGILEAALRSDRVHRRCARVVAEYKKGENVILVKKIIRSVLSRFGYQDKNGKFLYPEEAVFLLETNRLELQCEGRALSIKEAYDVLLSNSRLKRYRVYKHLVSQGYKLIPKSEFQQSFAKTSTTNVVNKGKETVTSKEVTQHPTNIFKRKTDIKACVHLKRTKIDPELYDTETQDYVPKASHSRLSYESFGADDSNDVESMQGLPKVNLEKEVNKIFDRIRQIGPKSIESSTLVNCPDYYAFLPNNVTKKKPDFSLYISEYTEWRQQKYSEDIPNVFAVCSGDNIAFYRFSNVNLPCL